jgi:hypothetical protein
LIVQRTGWGKNIVYFLATRLLRDQGQGDCWVKRAAVQFIRLPGATDGMKPSA